MSKKQQTKHKIKPRLWIMIVLFFFAAFLPRVFGLDQTVTPDEHKWLARSANFYQAISQADWANTFQREHPGVTVMWAGTLAFWEIYPDYAQDAPGQFTWEDDYLEQWLLQHLSSEVGNTNHKPLDLLAAGRWWIAFAISLILALSYLPLRRLFGEKAALLALLFVIWEPFHIALSHQLHPDGLSASLTFLALTTFLVWFDKLEQWRYLIFSAAVMSLAWLTKSPTILLVPIAGLLIALKLWAITRKNKSYKQISNLLSSPPGRSYIVGLLLWSSLSLIIFVVLWPALWIDPLGTLTRMAQEVDVYIEGHGRANYFLGQPTADPGLLFYPIAYFFRTTPLVLIALMAAIVLVWRQEAPFDDFRTRQLVGALFSFVLLFTIVITTGAKKFDRYLLPAFLCLDVIAALGLIALWKWAYSFAPSRPLIRKRQSGTPSQKMSLAVALILLGHGLPGFLHYPHYLSYYNPLVGGSATAPQVMMIGWGEGLDEAARYLNRKTNAEQLVVSSWYPLGSFSYFFKGQHTLAPKDIPDPTDNKRHWFSTDYVVFYANQWQRELPTPELLDYFFAMPPEQLIRIAGLDYARIYNLHQTPINDYLGLHQPPRTDWDNAIRLMGVEFDEPLKHNEPFQVTFYLRSMAPIERDVSALVRLVDINGDEWGRSEGWPWERATSSWQFGDTWPDTHEFTLPAEAAATLRLELSFYDPITLEHLPATDVQTGQPIGHSLLIELPGE